MHHDAGAEEQQRLEERVRHEVEHARHRREHADADEHEAELADGRIGEDLLQIELPQRDGARRRAR